MSCISASLDRVYESTISFVGDYAVISICTLPATQGNAALLNTEQFKASLIKENTYVELKREGAIKCMFTYVCDVNFQQPYLEVSPEIVWIYSDLETSNDVISNTTWYIN